MAATVMVLGLLTAPAAQATPGPELASSSSQTSVVARFDPQRNETPESIAISPDGDRYVSLASTGEIRRITPGGQQTTLATLPLGGGSLLALALDRRENVYANLASFDPATHGIWRITPEGQASRLVALPADGLPNGLTFAPNGDLYAADSFRGLIYRVTARTGQVEVWLDDRLLAPVNGTGFPGANGLQYFRGALYTANSDQGTVIRIPIDRGHPGEPRVLSRGVAVDDFALDIRGNVYATTDPANTLVLITPDGEQHVLLDAADGLDGPTAAAFGRGREANILYITNAAFAVFDTDGIRNPSVIAYRTPTRGYHPALPVRVSL